MATLLLSTAGAAIGGQIGGSILGVSAAAIGQAAGSIAGSLVDQSLLATGSARAAGPRLDRLHLQTAGEGAPLPRVWGRMRVGGRVVWAANFRETVTTQTVGGGKGGGGGAEVDEYAYSLSFAIALAEGPIDRIGRVWADGAPFLLSEVSHRFYFGGEDQLPDDLIIATEGPDAAPAFRGAAYLIFEDLPLGPFGNRVPQFSVEVYRQPPARTEAPPSLSSLIKGVALSPGSGEFALATTPVRRVVKEGVYRPVNTNAVEGQSDLATALDQLQAELPGVETVSLIISWFGTDLRCAQCEIRPGVERRETITAPLTWTAGGASRTSAYLISGDAEGRPNFGGTPADASVIEAIQELKGRGLRVLIYPFILMDVPADNSLPDPYSDAANQPSFPWRGRITASIAPGRPGSPDKTAATATEITTFFGTATASDFAVSPGAVTYSGPADFRYRRFILHCAALAAAAGGVDAFAIGSEMRGLTQLRDGPTAYPAVAALKSLAAEARALLPSAKLTYAADWSEYFGHHPADGSGDVLFHLDPLWADSNIDAVAIDAYFPLSDWRDDGDPDHPSPEAASIYDIAYLESNIEGGEYFDWFYASAADRLSRNRSPITDGAHNEPWIYRAKDMRAWWSNPHHNRPGGVRDSSPTAWVPQSKPIWFTEIGCPAADRGANQPNVFYDPKSSESALPHFSRGARDDEIQRRYLQAALDYWSGPANPFSSVYGGPMLDLSRAHVWTWDARPWPDFPARRAVWSDGGVHGLGHWLTGRLGAADLPDTIAEICAQAGLTAIDVSGLAGMIHGLLADQIGPARGLLETLMLSHGLDAVESGGALKFIPRTTATHMTRLTPDDMALPEEESDPVSPLERSRLDAPALPRAVRLSYLAAEGDYDPATVEATREAAAA
ncbi:MAG: glycoside hydrolase/phage tail family protein, partial [Rhodobacteraceae bacterium]|nr:glycoside hydrolase/phage tail family protein [Paracoccaceae bacterium]